MVGVGRPLAEYRAICRSLRFYYVVHIFPVLVLLLPAIYHNPPKLLTWLKQGHLIATGLLRFEEVRVTWLKITISFLLVSFCSWSTEQRTETHFYRWKTV